MALTAVATGDTVAAADVNQFKNALEGAATATYLLNAAATTHLQFKLADAAGTYKLLVLDSAGVTVASIDSDGNMTLAGSFAPGSITFPTSASPSQTTEAAAVWDSDDDLLTVGTGSVTKRINLHVAAGGTVTNKGESTYDTTSRQLLVHDGTSGIGVNPVRKYAAATQTVSASTTFVDAIAAGSPATFTFTMAASEIWHAKYYMRFLYTGTGGLKLQFTGPGSPTAVRITGLTNLAYGHGSADAVSPVFPTPLVLTTAFSTVFGGVSAGNGANAGTTAQLYQTTDNYGAVTIDLFIVNGTNAGAVTLQIAQNSANGTTIMQIGSHMEAIRVA